MIDLKSKSAEIRRDILTTVYNAKAGHIGGDFSVCDILTVLYNRHLNIDPQNPRDPNRDRFVLSKGHCAEALYCVLADRGFFLKSELDTFSRFGSVYIGHPNNKVRGVEVNTGSLGHGLPIAVGMALAGKMDGAPYRVYVVMGDGELAEGSVWEGVMAAAHYKLDNLTAVIDRNRLQISGPTDEVMRNDKLEDKFRCFGWDVMNVDGNDVDALDKVFAAAKHANAPAAVIADTVKGRGVSFMENQLQWHHGIPSEAEYKDAMEELSRY